MDDYEMSCKMQLAQAFKKQDLKVGAIEQGISEDLDQLCNDEISLQSMFDHEDLLLVYMTQAVDNLYSKTVNFKPSIDNFDDLVVNVDVEQTHIKTVLAQSHEITLDALRDEESKKVVQRPAREENQVFEMAGPEDAGIEDDQKAPVMTIDRLLQRDEHWLCTWCGQRRDGTEIICAKCLKFRPTTFYPNLAHSPDDVTHAELKAIHRRRKLERQLVIAAEKAGHSLPGQSQIWYMVSNKWLYKWKCFMQNEVTLNSLFDNEEWAASISLSTNSEIGVLPPGLISNEEDLFSDAQEAPEVHLPEEVIAGKAIKKDLRVNIDYRAVNPFVWYLFFVNYGGVMGSAQAPQLPREAIDIYSRDMRKLIKIYWGEGRILPQTKL